MTDPAASPDNPPALPPAEWFRRRFSDPQVLLLTGMIVGFLVMLYLFGSALTPFFASVIIAYLLDGPMTTMEQRHIPRWVALSLVFTAFLVVVLFLLVTLLPMFTEQLQRLVGEIPRIVSAVQDLVRNLPERYPGFIEPAYMESFVSSLGARLEGLGGQVVSLSLSYIPGLMTLLVYVVLVPFLILFMLKDKSEILAWLSEHIPRHRGLFLRVWHDVDRQMGNFIRGKAWEILIVGVLTWATFWALGFNYAVLMGVMTGVSVLIPYIGAAVVTIPVALLGYFQWGLSWDLGYLVIAYSVLQGLDGNVLVPLIFSEAVKLHPVAIILSILVFGSIWGFWGIFFAIPLATLVKAILDAVPRLQAEAGDG